MAEKPEQIKVLVTAGPTAPESNSTLKTPAGDSNVQVVTMTWYSQVGIRVLRTYLQSLLGFVIAVGTGAAAKAGIAIPAHDFLTLLISSASLAVAPAVICLLQNAIEILTKLDTTTPEMRA